MADAPRPPGPADRNLLFGILALQMDFISRDQLVAAMHAWVLEKTKSLGEILLEQNALAAGDRALLEPLVDRHIAQHGGDPEKSLAALGQISSLEESLANVTDADVQASLGHLQARDASRGTGTVDWRSASPDYTGPRFRILRPHARGGLGEVFVAEDQELHREVALKEIQNQHADEPFSRTRFLMEAEITGGLEHPGIVPVYGLGSYGDGRPYYAMRFIRGDSLKEAIAQFHANAESKRDPLALRQLLRRFTDVCNAMAYAHSRGVLHRDLKPGNIMLGKYGETLIVDWGLAKTTAAPPERSASASGLEAASKNIDFEAPLKPTSGSNVDPTQMGSAIGTPGYMSPEQSAGRLDELSPASDVYSLGATLYVLLAGKPAFAGDDKGELLRKVQKGDFTKPRQINSQIPATLEAICLKAMALAPGDRYATPRTLADDIEHWLADEPVSAHRESIVARGRRWLRRHKSVAAASVAAGLMAIVGSSLIAVLTSASAEKERTLRGLAEASKEKAESQEKDARHNLYVAHMNLAQQAWESANVGRVREFLDLYRQPGPRANDPRGWEWYYQDRLCQQDLRTFKGHLAEVNCVAFSPDGSHLASASTDKTVKLWDVATGNIIRSLTHQDYVLSVAFSPDGALLASASTDRTLKLWDVVTGKEMRSFKGTSSDSLCVTFSPDGARLASANRDNTVRLWDIATGNQIRTLEGGHTIRTGSVSGAHSVAFSPDGALLASASNDETLKLWDAATGGEIRSFKGHAAYVLSVAFSHDGTRLASSGYDSTVKLWETATGKEIRTFKGHPGFIVRSVAFSPDGFRIASAGHDRTVKLWDIATGNEIHTFKGHASAVISVAFSPDGARLASASADKTVKLWGADATGNEFRTGGGQHGPRSVAFSPDGARLASGNDNRTLNLSDAATGKLIRTFNGHAGIVHSVAFSPNGARLASASADQTVKLWEAATGNEIHTFKGHIGVVASVTFTPDGTKLASAGYDGTVKVWDAVAGNEIRTLKGHAGKVNSVAFSFDGTRLASASEDRTVKLWDATNGNEILTFKGHTGEVYCVTFSKDGTYLASASFDRTVKLWDPMTASEVRTFNGHTGFFRSVTFSPDGTRLASSGYDRFITLWDTATGNAIRTLKGGHLNTIESVTFSPDGTLLASASNERTITLWDATPLSPDGREEREAKFLVEFFVDRRLSGKEVITSVQNCQGITASVRQTALKMVNTCWNERIEAPAATLVKIRYRDLLLHSEVLEAIKSEKRISEGLRARALAIAREYPENADALNMAAWQVVRIPASKLVAYQRAMRLAEAASRLQPDNGYPLNTLGVAQYRVGQYAQALETLLRSEKLNATKTGSIPGDLAFLAMTYYKLGRKPDADATLVRLREAVKRAPPASVAESQGFLAEAEKLLGAVPTPKKN